MANKALNRASTSMTNDAYTFPPSVHLLSNPIFKNELVSKLILKLSEAPTNKLYRLLVDVYRRSGDLNSAENTAKEWQIFSPNNNNALFFIDLFSQKNIINTPYLPQEIQPALFTIVDDFLTNNERSHFWKKAIRSQQDFTKCRVSVEGGDILDAEIRNTDVLRLEKHEKELFREKISSQLNAIFERLQLPIKQAKKIEVKLTAHNDGGFFKIHQDGFEAIEGTVRVVSWVYYFHAQPKRFNGGDLVLFDSLTQEKDHKCNTINYTRYIPRDNQLVLFPSYFYHGVTPVSFLEPGFESGRFAIAGHIRC